MFPSGTVAEINVRIRTLIAVMALTSATAAQGTEAEDWAQATGALMGMASGCGIQISQVWTRNIVRRRERLAGDQRDRDNASAVFEKFATRAFIAQSAGR